MEGGENQLAAALACRFQSVTVSQNAKRTVSRSSQSPVIKHRRVKAWAGSIFAEIPGPFTVIERPNAETPRRHAVFWFPWILKLLVKRFVLSASKTDLPACVIVHLPLNGPRFEIS